MSAPDHTPAAGQLIDQEGQYGGFLRRRVGLESFGLQALSQRRQFSLSTVSFHIDLQHLGHIVPVQADVSHMVSQSGLCL